MALLAVISLRYDGHTVAVSTVVTEQAHIWGVAASSKLYKAVNPGGELDGEVAAVAARMMHDGAEFVQKQLHGAWEDAPMLF